MTPYELEEEQRKRGAPAPPPPPVTAGTPYGVPTPQAPPPVSPVFVTPYRGAAANPGTVPVPPPPAAGPAPAPVPMVRNAPVPTAPPADPNAPPPGETMGVTATGQFETPQQREARLLQLRSANEAIATIEGRTPSVAHQQLARGLNQAQAQQNSQAAAARGMGVAGARRLAARNIGELQQGAVGQTAELRAGEVADARKQLADIAGQVRTQDIDTTTQGAAMLERAKRNANDFEVSMQDLELREKLGMLTDARERAQLEENRRSNQAIEALKSRGLDQEAQKQYEEMLARNKEFWGNAILGIVKGASSVAAGGATGGAVK